MTSIRFHIGRFSEGVDCLIERISEQLRHIVIETKPSDDCTLSLLLAIGVNANSIGAKQDNVLGAEKPAPGNAVDNEFLSLSEINKHGIIFGHCDQPFKAYPFVLGGEQWFEVESIPQRESTA